MLKSLHFLPKFVGRHKRILFLKFLTNRRKEELWVTWLAKLVEHLTLDLQVASLSPTKGIEVTLKIKQNCLKQKRKKEELCQNVCICVCREGSAHQ